MKAIAILIKGGLVAGVYNVLNAPEQRVFIIDDDNLAQSGDRETEALQQLEGYEPDGDIEFNEIHSELSNWISSEDLVDTQEEVFLSCCHTDEGVYVSSACIAVNRELKRKIKYLQEVMKQSPILDSVAFRMNDRIKELYSEDANDLADGLEPEVENDFRVELVNFVLYKHMGLKIEVLGKDSTDGFELEASQLLKLV